MEIIPPIDWVKCLKIYLKHFITKILLELIMSKTSPMLFSKKALPFIKSLFPISWNLQLHEASNFSKSIPSIWQPSSHKEAFG